MVSNKAQSSQADTFLRSITSLNGLLQTADSTLNSVVTALQRAISLGVEGANGTLSDSDRADVASELAGIKHQLQSLANTPYQGEFIFSGTSTVQPFVADATSASGVTYNGNAGTNKVEVGQNYSLQVNQPGSQLFTSPSGNVFQSISDLINALQTNNNIGRAEYRVPAAHCSLLAADLHGHRCLPRRIEERHFYHRRRRFLPHCLNRDFELQPVSERGVLGFDAGQRN